MAIEAINVASIGMQVSAGAGLSSLKLHNEFLRLGHNSRFYVARMNEPHDHVYTIPVLDKFTNDWWKLGTIPLANDVNNIVASGLSGMNTEFLEEVHQWADIILLRWVTAAISDWQIGLWSHREKPVVWGLSDMAPFTGGCHYSQGCNRYEIDCSECPMVEDRYKNNPSLVLQRRKKLWEKLTIISPSNWLADCARKSMIFKGKDIRVIQTGVELDIYHPTPRLQAINELGIDDKKINILFGAHASNDERKGYNYLDDILEAMISLGVNPDDIQLLIVGKKNVRLFNNQIPYVYFGQIDDKHKMAKVYSASHLSLLPYTEDNLSNMVLESISCGTPVSAFNIGGMPDVIKPGINGYLTPPFDTRSMANAVTRLIKEPLPQEKIRSWAESNINLKTQAQKYIKLFNELLSY